MRTHVVCVKIKPYSSPAACSSASVHHRYGTDSARNAGEVPRISHAPQIGETQDAEVWCAVSPPPRPENHVNENAVDVYAPDNNNNNNPRNSLSVNRFWEYAVLSLKFILNQHYLDVVKNRIECFLTPDKEGDEAYAVRATSGPSPC